MSILSPTPSRRSIVKVVSVVAIKRKELRQVISEEEVEDGGKLQKRSYENICTQALIVCTKSK